MTTFIHCSTRAATLLAYAFATWLLPGSALAYRMNHIQPTAPTTVTWQTNLNIAPRLSGRLVNNGLFSCDQPEWMTCSINDWQDSAFMRNAGQNAVASFPLTSDPSLRFWYQQAEAPKNWPTHTFGAGTVTMPESASILLILVGAVGIALRYVERLQARFALAPQKIGMLDGVQPIAHTARTSQVSPIPQLPHSPLHMTQGNPFNPSTIVGQEKLLEDLFEIANKAGMPAPGIPPEALSAIASIKGHIRNDNQDYCLALQFGNVSALLSADGCGGSPHGAYAAYTAVRGAAKFLVENDCGNPASDIGPLAQKALFHASDTMAKIAGSTTPPITDGFRTTLIVILADTQRYAFAYAGDGGGVVLRRDGRVEQFLFPQKMDIDTPDVIATSLGPMLEGEPACGSIPRYPGDLLLTGSDGLWDYVRPSFPLAAAHELANEHNSIRKAATALVGKLADAIDQQGYICRDNITLGMISTPRKETVQPTIPADHSSFVASNCMIQEDNS